MKNNTPFEILDNYKTECYNLYIVVQSLFNYPDISEDEDIEGKLYATAFTFLCQDFLKVTIDAYGLEDMDEFVENMNFKIHKKFITKRCEKYGRNEGALDKFPNLVWSAIKFHQDIIKKDIRQMFKEDRTILKFFSSIFKMEGSGFMPSLGLDTIGVFEEDF